MRTAIDEQQLRDMAARVAAGEPVRAVAREGNVSEATLRRPLRALQADAAEPASAPAAPPAPTPPVPPIPHGDRAHAWPPPEYLARLKADFDAGLLRGGPYGD